MHSSAHPPEPSHLLVLNSKVVLRQCSCYIQREVKNRTTSAINMTAPWEDSDPFRLQRDQLFSISTKKKTTFQPSRLSVALYTFGSKLGPEWIQIKPFGNSPFQKIAAPLHQGAALHVACTGKNLRDNCEIRSEGRMKYLKK